MPWIQPSAKVGLKKLLPPEFIEQWACLARTTSQGDPFSCGPCWNLAYYDIFHRTTPVFYARGRESVILFTRREDPDGIRFVPLEDSWMFGQPLLGNDAPVVLLRHLHELLGPYRYNMQGIYISGIRRSSDLAKMIFECYGRIFHLYAFEPWQNATASLMDGIPAWEQRRSANFRANLRKARHRADRLGITFERVLPTPDNWKAVYARMTAVEEGSWKGLSETGLSESHQRKFYGALLCYLAENGAGRVMFARFENRDVGFIFGGIQGNVYRGQQFSYRQELARHSLGNLMQYEQIKWLVEEGITRYDMGSGTGPRMDYKTRWAEDYKALETWLLTSSPILKNR